jgi:hypothetical protein
MACGGVAVLAEGADRGELHVQLRLGVRRQLPVQLGGEQRGRLVDVAAQPGDDRAERRRLGAYRLVGPGQLAQHLFAAFQVAGEAQGAGVLEQHGRAAAAEWMTVGQQAQRGAEPAGGLGGRSVRESQPRLDEYLRGRLVAGLGGALGVVRHHLPRTAVGAEVYRGAGVRGHPPRRAGQLVGGGPHQRMPEPQLRLVHVHQPKPVQLVGALDDRVDRQLGDGRDELQGRVVAGDRRRVRHPPHPLVEVRDVGDQPGEDLALRRVEIVVVHQRGERVVAEPGQRLEVEGVAAAGAQDQRPPVPGQPRQQRVDVVRPEVRQADVGGEPAGVGDRLDHTGRWLPGAEGDRDQRRPPGWLADQVLGQLQRRLVGPVQVVQEQRDRGCVGGVEELPHARVDPCPVHRRAGAGVQRVAVERVPHRGGLLRRGTVEQWPQCLRVRAERHVLLELGGLARADQQPGRRRPPPQLPHHAGLADARLAAEHDRRELATRHGRRRRVERLQLAGAADQGHRRTDAPWACGHGASPRFAASGPRIGRARTLDPAGAALVLGSFTDTLRAPEAARWRRRTGPGRRGVGRRHGDGFSPVGWLARLRTTESRNGNGSGRRRGTVLRCASCRGYACIRLTGFHSDRPRPRSPSGACPRTRISCTATCSRLGR